MELGEGLKITLVICQSEEFHQVSGSPIREKAWDLLTFILLEFQHISLIISTARCPIGVNVVSIGSYNICLEVPGLKYEKKCIGSEAGADLSFFNALLQIGD